jgi:hypothetical protein
MENRPTFNPDEIRQTLEAKRAAYDQSNQPLSAEHQAKMQEVISLLKTEARKIAPILNASKVIPGQVRTILYRYQGGNEYPGQTQTRSIVTLGWCIVHPPEKFDKDTCFDTISVLSNGYLQGGGRFRPFHESSYSDTPDPYGDDIVLTPDVVKADIDNIEDQPIIIRWRDGIHRLIENPTFQ